MSVIPLGCCRVIVLTIQPASYTNPLVIFFLNNNLKEWNALLHRICLSSSRECLDKLVQRHTASSHALFSVQFARVVADLRTQEENIQ